MKKGLKIENFICSNCFKDEGLKLDAFKIGIYNHGKCKNCGSTVGKKLNADLVINLCYRFFVRGTIEKSDYGGYPLIMLNEAHYQRSDIHVSPWLKDDLKLLEKIGKIGMFYYGPRAWMFGEIEPLLQLQLKSHRNRIINEILNKFPVKEISKTDYLYRIRVNPKIPYKFSEYDSPPNRYLGNGRFDSMRLPVLYCSQDLEICMHECRVTVEDEIFVSKLVPTRKLRLLNLTEEITEENYNEFTSLDITIRFLFFAGKHSYEICRAIARKAKASGFDGIIYTSYFNQIRTGSIPYDTSDSINKIDSKKEFDEPTLITNLAIFGRPVKENKIKIACINKVLLNKVSYETSFGPAYHNAY